MTTPALFEVHQLELAGARQRGIVRILAVWRWRRAVGHFVKSPFCENSPNHFSVCFKIFPRMGCAPLCQLQALETSTIFHSRCISGTCTLEVFGALALLLR